MNFPFEIIMYYFSIIEPEVYFMQVYPTVNVEHVMINSEGSILTLYLHDASSNKT